MYFMLMYEFDGGMISHTELYSLGFIQFRIIHIEYAIMCWILNIIVIKYMCLVCDMRTTMPLLLANIY